MTQQKLEMAPPCPGTWADGQHRPGWSPALGLQQRLSRSAKRGHLCALHAFPSGCIDADCVATKCQAPRWLLALSHPLPPPYEVGPSLIFQGREMRPREVK